MFCGGDQEFNMLLQARRNTEQQGMRLMRAERAGGSRSATASPHNQQQGGFRNNHVLTLVLSIEHWAFVASQRSRLKKNSTRLKYVIYSTHLVIYIGRKSGVYIT